jgi:putative hemolysin
MRIRQTLGTGVAVAAASVMALATLATGASETADAEAYCGEQGGNVVALTPYLLPGSDQQVEMAGPFHVCQFISEEDGNPVQIAVDLLTLYSEQPTLAGIAYLSKVPSSDSGAAGANPAPTYCEEDLGGTEAFGTSASGAWVGELDPGMEAGATEPLGDTIVMCVFADRSAIDEFGLFYASQGIVRGKDLSTVMRYQPDGDLPAVFDSSS